MKTLMLMAFIFLAGCASAPRSIDESQARDPAHKFIDPQT